MNRERKTWLHFIGRQYYTMNSFIKEAETFGVSRRVSIRTLKQMEYGDRVLCAINDGKSSLAFGSFLITGITGLSAKQFDALSASYGVSMVDIGGGMVERGCGSYVCGPTCRLDTPATLSEIVETIEDLEKDNGLMVSGKLLQMEPVRLLSMSHHMGFREFDYEKFLSAVQDSGKKRQVKGYFYAHGKDITEELTHLDTVRQYQSVTNYRRK